MKLERQIIGVDEVGRGCLAGPVVAAAVRFKGSLEFKVYDSKKISQLKREELTDLIHKNHDYAIGLASVEEIDQINILQASLLAMTRAIEKLNKNGYIMVDGNQKLPNLNVRWDQECIIKGDQKVPQISAASIIAKVYRDKLMADEALAYPNYGFEKHKGYGTAVHRVAIAKHGVLNLHRKSFKGVKEYV